VVHVLPAQQVWPSPPHGEQLPATHAMPDAVQRLPVQQGWFMPPQLPHEPLEHTPRLLPHELPLPTH
jgi:hypothetical protein